MIDRDTRLLLREKMSDSLQAAAKLAFVLDMDSAQFMEEAKAEYKATTSGTLVPGERGVIVPARHRGRKGVRRLWCPTCSRWTDKIEIEPETGRQIHGGRKGCGCELMLPDEVGRVRVANP